MTPVVGAVVVTAVVVVAAIVAVVVVVVTVVAVVGAAVVAVAVVLLVVVVAAVVALGVMGCVALDVALVIPRAVRSYPLLPLPKCVATVVKHSKGRVEDAGCVEERLVAGFDAVVLATAVETVTCVLA